MRFYCVRFLRDLKTWKLNKFPRRLHLDSRIFITPKYRKVLYGSQTVWNANRQTFAEVKAQRARVNENLIARSIRTKKSEFVIMRDKANKARELRGRPFGWRGRVVFDNRLLLPQRAQLFASASIKTHQGYTCLPYSMPIDTRGRILACINACGACRVRGRICTQTSITL